MGNFTANISNTVSSYRTATDKNYTDTTNPSTPEQQQAQDISKPTDNTRATAQRVAQKSTRNTSYLSTNNTQDSGLTPEEQKQLDQDMKRAKSETAMCNGLNEDFSDITQKIEENEEKEKKEFEAEGKTFTAADIDAVMESTMDDAMNSISPYTQTPHLTGQELEEIEKEADKIYDTGAAGKNETKEEYVEDTIQMMKLNNKYKMEDGKSRINENEIDDVAERVAQTEQQHSPDTQTALLGELFLNALIYIPDPKSRS